MNIESLLRGRLERRPTEVIDRTTPIKFHMDGRLIPGLKGDTVASALHAAGVTTLSRSFKYHRRRGLFCCSGACPNCLMTVDGIPNQRVCTMDALDGLEAARQNAWPSTEQDALSILEKFGAWLPVGFYYKSMVRPRFLWRLAEPVIRKFSGLGAIDRHEGRNTKGQQHEYAHSDVVVVGAGASGMTAALEAASTGATVTILDEQPFLGGRLRTRVLPIESIPVVNDEPGYLVVKRLAEQVVANSRITVERSARVFGFYEGNLLVASTPERLLHVRSSRTIIATGAPGAPVIFTGNDLPGVMLGEAALRLVNLYAVAPGDRVVVMTLDPNGLSTARELASAGVNVVAVLDASIGSDSENVPKEVPVIRGRVVHRARGRQRVEAIEIADITEFGGSRETIKCDTLVVEGPPNPELWLADQGGASVKFEPSLGHAVAGELPPDMFVVGNATGERSHAERLVYARDAGQAAARRGSGRPSVVKTDRPAMLPVLAGSSGKRFVCLCEDVTDKDITTAVGESFTDIQILKRYTTATMGPCQGRSCHASFVATAALALGCTPQDMGATTARPTGAAVTLAQLAGPSHVPIKRTPMHERQVDMGARMVELGPWERAYSFGSVLEEYRAVRDRVGLIDVSSLGKIELRGSAVPEVLDKVYTGNMSNLRPGRIRYGVMCTDAGVIMDDGTVARLATDKWLITTTSGNAETIEQWLRWWAADFPGDFWLTNLTGALGAINLAGPKARDTLEQVTDVDLRGRDSSYMRVLEGRVAGVPAILLRIGFVGETGWEIHCAADRSLHVWDSLLEAGHEYGIKAFGLEAQRVLRLEKGHIIVSQDTDSMTTPIEAGMEWAIRFSKPDFVGRAALLVKSKQDIQNRLVHFVMVDSDLPKDGEPVVINREPVGRVTSIRYSPAVDRGMGLAWVPSNVSEPGCTFDVFSGGKLVVAQVASEVAYDPAGERLRQ